MRENWGRGTERESDGKERESPEERTHFIYAARYEKIEMKRYIMS